MQLQRSRVILGVGGIGLLLASGAYFGIKQLWRRVDDRVYVIGWQNSPPFQEQAADGSPTGLAVDLVRDAARRRGIRLRWAWCPEGPEPALFKRKVDLWPLITITPEREAKLHISKPFLQHDYDLLVRAKSAYSQVQDLKGGSVSYVWMLIDQQFLSGLLPHARLVTVASGEEAIENLCAERTDAAFMNEFTAGAVLLSGTSCSSQPLRVIPVPSLRTKLGVGSTLEASGVADEIRRGIDTSVLEGDAEKILKSGGYLSARNMQYFTALLDAQRQDRWLRSAVIVFTCLLALTLFAADHIRRQRNRIAATDRAVRQSERRFRELLENVKLVGVMTDAKGTINFWNNHAAAVTGWSKEEAIGRPAREFLDLGPPLPDARGVGGAPPAGSPPSGEGSVLQKGGGRRWTQWSSTPLRDSAGRLEGLANLGEDVTELRALRAEAARVESEEQFRKMADTAPLMIWTAGSDMRCTFANKAWLEFAGNTLEEELGDGWTANIHPDDFKQGRAVSAAAFAARRNVELEFRKRRADGEYRWMLGSGVPRFGPDGQLLGYVGTMTDITDLKRSRDEDTARQKLETVGRLAGGIAHDFNNILGGVLAQADLALGEISDGAVPEEELNSIRGVAIRGAGIVRQLMIYAGQESAVSEPVDVSGLVDDMRDLLKAVVSRHIVLKTDLGPELPAVQANPAQLRQVVMNLAANASEAIGEGDGSIVIRTGRGPADADGPRAAGGEWLELAVSDTGCGIKPEEQSKVFDPFYTTKSAGHGLGLAVVQRVVRNLGGTIHLASELGKGTTFQILLPCVQSTAEEPADALLGGGEPARESLAATILIVEDEDALRQAVAKVLRRTGAEVLEAANGSTAIDLLRQHSGNIDVILLDLTIPGASAQDVLTGSAQARPNSKVVLTSAYSEEKAAGMGGPIVQGFIRKPFKLRDLIETLRNVLSS
jgi:PAS domain S-box-containing protein